MLVFHFAFTETLREHQILYRSVVASDLDEALETVKEEFPWFNLLAWDVIDGQH